MKMTSQYPWRTVADHCQVMADFSKKGTSRHSQVDLSGPQVYRFLFSGKPLSSYIGQSNDFSRRYREYRTLDRPTEQRVRGFIHSAKSRKSTVELQFLDFEKLDLSGVLVVKQLLTSIHVRRMLESWAILKDERSRIHILNSWRGSTVTGLNGQIVPQPNLAERYRETDSLDGKRK
jgi:hypothetical protein